jgi:hypothetical protein
MAEVNMKITQEGDTMTSLGRLASHVSLTLKAGADRRTHTTYSSGPTYRSSVQAQTTQGYFWTTALLNPTVRNFLSPEGTTSRVPCIAHVRRKSDEEPGTFLSLQMPEKVNLICELNSGGSVTIVGKVEGDIRLYTADVT